MSATYAGLWVSFAANSTVGSVEKSIHSSSTRVHRFHQESSREIWKRYATTHLEPAVASALAAGVLRKEELPSELLQHIAGLIEFYEHDRSAS